MKEIDTLHKILDLIWKKGISEIDFCTELGINKSAVTDWKKGKTASYKKHIPKIADYFGVPVEYFTENTENTHNANLAVNRWANTKTIITFGNNLGGQTYIVPEDKAERFRKLIEAAMPEILEDMEKSDF